MRLLMSIVVAAALCCLLGCAKHETGPAEQPKAAAETQTGPQPIASEDFESGKAEAVVVETEGEEEGSEPDTTP